MDKLSLYEELSNADDHCQSRQKEGTSGANNSGHRSEKPRNARKHSNVDRDRLQMVLPSVSCT